MLTGHRAPSISRQLWESVCSSPSSLRPLIWLSMSSITSLTPVSAPTRRWRWWRSPAIVVGLLVIAFWVVGTLIAPVILPYQPLQQNINDSLQPPGAAHLWGADKLGRDIFTRVLYGTRISLPAGLIAVMVSLVIGTTVGALAG